MKVTAIIPDDLIKEVRELTKGKNITDSLLIALREWSATEKIKQLKQKVQERPLTFKDGFTYR
jgi:hypothetical protein